MKREIEAMQATASRGSNHLEKVYKKTKNSLLSCTSKMVNEAEAACDLMQKGKAAYEDAEMDPEIQHLIKILFWEIDNCPQNLIAEMAINVSKTEEEA